MDELAKLLATRRDARVAVIGAVDVVARYVGEVQGSSGVLFLDEAGGLLGKREQIEQHDGPVVLGVRSLRSIPRELRTDLVVVRAPRGGRWRRLRS
ncbi:MAG TPA: hypothetical protein VM049_10325 [Gaiellaceae bacterium]|nr:hypothetical protein [Gaiellaceae bacterium]